MFRQLALLLSNKDDSRLLTRKLYTSCVRRCMLHGSETVPVNKQNELTLQRADMKMIGWMCGVEVADRFTHKELTERAGIHI